jgi:geranylgeranyl diphosphate synthase type II
MYTFQDAAKIFDEFYQKNIIFPQQPHNLYEPCKYTLEGFGKRIRPILCIMGYQLFDENTTEDVFHAALSFEMFHNFTLIHDDIMDNAPIRRGKPSVFNHFGQTAAILSGDVMNICAYDRLAQVSVDLKLVQLLRLFNKTAIEICEGQQLDMDYEEQPEVSIDAYIEMIRLKTSVLLAACLKAGGILANASPKNLEILYKYGIDLGIAFQIQDDYLDTFGTEASIGKQPGGDIRSNKKTPLSIFLRQNMGKTNYQEQMEIINKLNDLDKYEAVKKLYSQYGVDTQVKALVAQYTQNAFSGLQILEVTEDKKKNLKDLTWYLLDRTK